MEDYFGCSVGALERLGETVGAPLGASGGSLGSVEGTWRDSRWSLVVFSGTSIGATEAFDVIYACFWVSWAFGWWALW